MGFCREVDDSVKIVLIEYIADKLFVAYITVDKHIAFVPLHGQQVFKVARVGQKIQIDEQLNILLLFEHILHKIRADEARAACNENSFHISPTAIRLRY